MPLPMYSAQPTPPAHPFDQIKQVIAVAAGKGGVGKSTVAVNMALALQWFGFSVGLLDADIYGPSIRKLLPEDTPPVQKGEMIIPAVSRGIQVMSMAYFGHPEQSASVRAPIANGIITQFIDKVVWGSLDYLIIDFPPGTGDIQLTLGQKARLSAAIMVTTPQEVAMMDVRKAMQLFGQLNVPIAGIIENMSYFLHPETRKELYLFGRQGGERLAREYGLPYLGGIPIDPVLSAYGDAGKSIFHTGADEAEHGQKAFTHATRNMLRHMNALKNADTRCLRSFELVWEV